MAKLKYFIARKQAKNGTIDYYWQCKPEVSEKYSVGKFVSLGKDEKQALIKWQELNKKLEYNKQKLKETGILPIIEQNNIEEGTLKHITELYLQDRKFNRLAERTKKDYKYIAKRLNNEILFNGQKHPLSALKVEKIDRLFCKTLYEKLLSKGNRTAEDFIKVLANILNTAIDYSYIKGENPCSKMIIEKNKPRDQVWIKEEFELFCNFAKGKNYIGLYVAMNLAYYTSQRQTDIINLKWSQIDEDFKYIKIQQSKTGAKVEIPLYKIKPLQVILRSIERKGEYVVIDQTDDKPYHDRKRLFSKRFDTIRQDSGINVELMFRDLRRTAILALDEAGCTPAEIASISGHALRSIMEMLETYSPKTRKKAESAMDKLHTQE